MCSWHKSFIFSGCEWNTCHALQITDIIFEEDRDIEGVFIRNEAMLEMAAQLVVVYPEELASAFILNVHHLRGKKCWYLTV